MKHLMKNKNYMLICFGSLISFLGDSIQDIALMWYIYSLTHSPMIASLSLIINFLPKVLFSPLSGIISDKYNRKHIIIMCDFFNGLFAIILGIMIYFNVTVYILLIITFIMSTLDTFYYPASMAIIPSIVKKEDLISANSFSSTLKNVVNISGPALAGILYLLINPSLLFIGNGISFIIASGFELFIKYAHNKEEIEHKERLKLKHRLIKSYKEYMAGFYIIKNDKFLLYTAIIGGGITNLFLAPISLYIPIYVSDILHFSSIYFGLMNSAITIGSLVASVMLIRLGGKWNKHKLIIFGFLIQGISLILFGIFKGFYGSFMSLIILGIALSITGININTIIQERIPSKMLGRCISVLMLISNICVPIGYFAGGYVVQFIGLNIILIFSGIIVAISGMSLIFVFRKMFHKKDVGRFKIKRKLKLFTSK